MHCNKQLSWFPGVGPSQDVAGPGGQLQRGTRGADSGPPPRGQTCSVGWGRRDSEIKTHLRCVELASELDR